MDGFDRRERRRRYQKQQRRRRLGIYAGIAGAIILVLVGVGFLCVSLFRHFTATKPATTQVAEPENQEEKPGNTEARKQYSLKNVQVMIDPGHGERVPGCVVDDIMEKDITLQVSLKLRDALEKEGAIVTMTREDDSFYPRLKERGVMANKAKVDYFISVHCNFYEDDPDIYGFESYYYGEDSAAFSEAMVKAAGAGGIAVQDSKYGNFQVLRDAKMPAVLLEIGYMSNEEELQNMCDEAYQQSLAEAITGGLAEYNKKNK